MRADPPPDLHAILTCDPAHDRFDMKTAESGYPIDEAWRQTADPDLTEIVPLGSTRPYVCHLPTFTISVRTINHRGGQERGECAVWDTGDFAVDVDGHGYAVVPAPRCDTQIRHDLSMQGRREGAKDAGLWSVDCAYRSDAVAFFEQSTCSRLREKP